MSASSTPSSSPRVLWVAAVGLGGLINDSWAAHATAATLLHALFGVLLLCSIVAAFYRRARQTPDILPAELAAFTRQVCRAVWLLLYGLIFFCLIVHLMRAASEHTAIAPVREFQSYLACGVFAIAAAHGLGWLWRTKRQRNGWLKYEEPASPKRQGSSIALEIPIRGPETTRTFWPVAFKLKGRLSRRLPFSW
jgi:hypothetical protein